MDYFSWNDTTPNKLSRREYLELINYIEKYFLEDDKDKIAKKMLNDKQRWYLWNGGLTNDVLGDWR
jgi:hypothetical protein